MKKHLILSSLILIPLLASCDTSRVNTPNSPFKDDKYVRIGMRTDGHHKIDENMSNEDYNELKSYINDKTQIDENVVEYHRQQEDRDLKYAYFGKESSAISQCTLTSIDEYLNRYSNRVRTDTSVTNKAIQTANGGIQKTKSTVTEYVFDSNYSSDPFEESKKYEIRRATKTNSEEQVVEQVQSPTEYDPDSKTFLYETFGLKPFTSRIKSHFPEELEFKLLGDSNNAVYGKNSEGKYIIKEGHSHFIDYSTTMGRTYKAVDNYFYEGTLERYEVPTPSNEEKQYSYRFLDFRFYHELLILSKAFSSPESIPILYLEKPALIEFSETTYSDITYCDTEESEFPRYPDVIPDEDIE